MSGTASPNKLSTARWQNPPGNGADSSRPLCFLAHLRRLDLWVPVSDALAVLGVGLLVYGLTCGLRRLLSEYSNLFACFFGLACLLGSALASHRGLLRLLPEHFQDKLFRSTPFDLMMQESEVTNIVRRWVRVWLLCQEHSEQEVQSIVKGLDPKFLDKVFKQSSFHMLPCVIRRLLLPSDHSLVPRRTAPPWRASRRGTTRTAGVGSLMARCVDSAPPRKRSSDSVEVLSVAGIRELLEEKQQALRRAAKEPSLTPVLWKLACKIVSIEAVCDTMVSHVASQGFQLVAPCFGLLSALLCSSAGIFFCSAKAGRASIIAPALSVLGVGASAALVVYARQDWFGLGQPSSRTPKDAVEAVVPNALNTDAGERAARPEPEMEESPQNSSSEFSVECRPTWFSALMH